MCRRTLCTLFAMLAIFAGTSWAQSQVRIVRLSYVEGDVQLDRNEGQGFTKAFLNLPIIEGSRLSTGTDGYAEAELEDGSTIRLVPNSLAGFPELTRDNTGTQTTVALTQGEAYFRWKQNHNDVLRVRSGDQIFTAKKKSHFRIGVSDTGSALAVFDGQLEALRPNGLKIVLKKNETLSLDKTDLERYFLARNITAEPFDDWDHGRQSDFDKQEQAIVQANSYANLNQYGSYITVPYYGSVWQPAGVGYGWTPYQDGSWVWYPSAGYVWVSSYPWGWAPYRYGSWLYVNNIGWCWQPGTYVNTWNTGPVFIHPPGGYNPPQPPRHHQDGIIIVGRPPRDFDGDHRWHPGSNGAAVGSSYTSTASSTPGSAATTNNTGPADVRPVRTYRDAGSVSQPQPIVRQDASSRPSTSPAPVATTTVANPAPRSERTERLPVQPTHSDSNARSYAPSPMPAPSRSEAPHFSPPQMQSAPGPRTEPPARSRNPK